MRTYTLLLSVMVHVCAIVAVYLSPLMASDALPALRTRVQWTPIIPLTLPPPGPDLPRRPTPRGSGIPHEAPDGFQPEAPQPSAPPGMNERAGLENGNGFLGDGVPGGMPGDGLEPPPPAVTATPAPQLAPLRVGGQIERPTKIVDVAPVYPSLAVQARTEGSVILEAVIAENGEVREVRVLRSIPLLDAAATDAVRQWRFTPTRLNGAPVSVLMTVTVTFRLAP